MSNLDEYSHSCVQKKKKTKKKDKYPFVLCWLVGCVRVYLNQKDTVLMNLSSICLQHIFNFSSSLPGSSSFAKIKNQTLQKTKKTEATFNFHFFCVFFFFFGFLCGKFQEPACFPSGFQRVMAGVARFKTRRKAAQNRSSGNLSFATMAANLFCTLQKIAKYTV